MGILKDARIADRQRVDKGFSSIQSYTGEITFYNPLIIGQTNYLGVYRGVPRRWSAVVGDDGDTLWWRVTQPKVSSSAPRTEAAFGYEASSLVRWFHVSFYLPSSGGDAWEEDSLSYTTICQWHEFEQPNGARQPPIEFVVAAGNVLQARLSHDFGLGGSGATGTTETTITTVIKTLELGRQYELVITGKAAGASNDYLTVWLDGTQVVSYSGYMGYPDATQNYFKAGCYCYFSSSSVPTHRTVYFPGIVVGDASETYATITQYARAIAPPVVTERPYIAIAGIGGTNAFGNSSSAQSGTSEYGVSVSDPVLPSTTDSVSIWPWVANEAGIRNVAAAVFNCAKADASIFAYTGRCRGTFQTSTTYTAGDSVLPSSPVGTSAFMSLGLKFICEVGGTSGGSAPTWPTSEYGTVTSNGIVWRAERRESFDVSNYIYSKTDLGFDPFGKLSEALTALHCARGANRRILLLMFGFEEARISASQANIVSAIESIADFMNAFDIEIKCVLPPAYSSYNTYYSGTLEPAFLSIPTLLDCGDLTLTDSSGVLDAESIATVGRELGKRV
jgi:hypothetical protein